jgi:hypothetical protein
MRMSLELYLDRVKANVERAGTEDLLDRATVYRNGMEPDALELIDAELHARGVGEADRLAHRVRRARAIYGSDGLAVKCVMCARPAVARKWRWHRLWGVLPVFPRPAGFCEVHLPEACRKGDGPPEEGAAPVPATPSD